MGVAPSTKRMTPMPRSSSLEVNPLAMIRSAPGSERASSSALRGDVSERIDDLDPLQIGRRYVLRQLTMNK